MLLAVLLLATASHTSAQPEPEVAQRWQEVCNFTLGAFQLEHTNLISPLPGATSSLVNMAVQASLQQLEAEVEFSLSPMELA